MAIQLRQSLLSIACMFGLLVDPLAAASPDHSGGEQAADAADAGSGTNARTPVPSDEKLTEASKDVQEVYSGELAAAKTTNAKKALAKKLLKTAGETDKAKDASARYTLLRMAGDYATQVGDVEIACGAVDEIVGTFEVDPLETRTAAIVKLATTVRAKDQHKALAAKGLSLIHAALVADNFPVARQIASLARAEAQKGADKALLDEIAELAAEIDSIAKGYDAAKTALATLKENASDPMANLAVGKYEALDKADWTSGLPKLAASSDAALKEAAAKDLAGAETTDARVALGDQWWELAEKQEGIAKRRIRARAASWYKLALPELSGLEKQKITRRVTQVSVELTKFGESIDKPGAGAVHKANRTELVGGPGGKPFEDQPAKRSLLAGFDITLGAWIEKPVPFIWSLEPVYVGDQGNFTTKIYGHQAREKIHAVVAKPGYAVAGMTVNSENIVNGFKLKFMRIRGTALDPTDSYDSDWIGGQWGKQQTILGGDGKPVIGCFGHAGDGVDSVGLILSE